MSRDYAGQPGDVRALLDGYAAGLNRYAGQQGLAMQGVPATNFLYADAAGNIAHFYNAALPNRRAGVDYRQVLRGDRSADFTPGTVPWAQVPRNVNPASGFLINANNTPYQAAGSG